MAYSLVSAPVLGFDLVRIPRGEQVAGVLVTALVAGPERLARLAAVHPGHSVRLVRRQPLEAVGPLEDVRTALPAGARRVDSAPRGPEPASVAVLRRLERAPMGSLEALERLVRHDLLDWSWIRSGEVAVQDPVMALAADVLVDAAASAYCAEALTDGQRRALAGPYLTDLLAPGGAGRRDAEGPRSSTAASGVLRVLSGADPAVRAAWRRAVDDGRADTAAWAPAVHEATWAVHLSGRTRLAAREQLRGVAAFARAGFTAQDGAYGVWNAVSGVVQAQLVADLLPQEQLTRLLRPWRAVYGGDPEP